MVIKRLFRSTLHEHPEPAQRVLGVSELPPDSGELAGLLLSDPAPEVRAAAARRCANLDALAAALKTESDSSVRSVLTVVLGPLLAETQDGESARTHLQADACNDAIRREVARRTQDADRRRIAIAALREESSLVDLALVAEHAETRMAAAELVRTPEGLARLAEGARDKDRGVTRFARKRLDAMAEQTSQGSAADEILAQLESLASTPGPILTAVIDLDRRWDALDLDHDPVRMARSQAARQVLLARFDREREEQQARGRFERRLGALIATPGPPATSEALAGLRNEVAELRGEAATCGDDATAAKLLDAERRFDAWEQELRAQADAEALVVEAEQLAAGTSIDNAELPERWQALSRAIRTPALTRRFEAAMVQVEQRRLAQVTAADQEANAARQDVHRLLHVAEQALTAGHVQAARAAAEEIRTRKPGAGSLPRPTTQRLSRLVQQLTELERWESFGQQSARTQLCERAEALATTPMEAPRLAAEVQKLRAEWKALDQQHAGVPKALWERFDRACETAYAPAARYFTEQAVQRKDARKRRDAFIEAAAAQVATLLEEPRDWRAIEHWLREADRTWRDGDLGSVDKKAWAAFDTRFRAAIAPLRDALAAARLEAKAGRKALIDEVTAVAAKAMERDAPVEGQGDPGAVADAGEGVHAGPARRTGTLGAVSRGVQCGVRRARGEAQAGRRRQARESPCARGDLPRGRAARRGDRQGRKRDSAEPPRSGRSVAQAERRRRPGGAQDRNPIQGGQGGCRSGTLRAWPRARSVRLADPGGEGAPVRGARRDGGDARHAGRGRCNDCSA